MGKLVKYVYAVGFYQVGSAMYQSAMSYYNSNQDERPMKERLAVFRNQAAPDGSEWAIITGASEGIGRSYALELARCGYNVRLAARSTDKLMQVAEEARKCNPAIEAEVVTLDVSKAQP